MLILAIGSMVTLSSRAVPGGDDAASRASDSLRAIDYILADAVIAIDVHIRDGGAELELKVPGLKEGETETDVVYKWDDPLSTGEQPLTRQEGDGSAETLLPGISRFQVSAEDGAPFGRLKVFLETSSASSMPVVASVELLNDPSLAGVLIPVQAGGMLSGVGGLLDGSSGSPGSSGNSGNSGSSK